MDTSTLDTVKQSESLRNQTGPKYDPATLKIIEEFLLRMGMEFHAKHASFAKLVGRDAHHPRFFGQLMYFRHAHSVIKYLFHRASQKQNALVRLETSELERTRDEWLSHLMTLEEEEALQRSASNTPESKTPNTRGQGSASGPNVNGEKPPRKRSRR